MNLLKLLVAGAAIGTIVAAFRDLENERWLLPAGLAGAGAEADEDEEEPVLGYDGMDRDTLIDWLQTAELDTDTLVRIHEYELAHRNRAPVLDAIVDLMG